MSQTIVIFGASGDLTSRKLVPALYELHRKKRLPEETRIVGFSRTPLSDEAWRAKLAESTAHFVGDHFDPASWETFAPWLFYQPGDIARPTTSPRWPPGSTDRGPAGGTRVYLPGHRAAVLRAGHRAARRRGAGPARPARRGGSSSRSPSAPTWPPPGSSTTRSTSLRRAAGLPHRPLPGQGDRAERAGAAVRQQHFRADLEPQLHRPRADHGGRGPDRRPPRRLLRLGRACCATCSRTTCCNC